MLNAEEIGTNHKYYYLSNNQGKYLSILVQVISFGK